MVLISGERTAFFFITMLIFSLVILYQKNFLKFFSFFFLYFIAVFLITLSTPDLKERMIDQTLQGLGIKQYNFDDGETEYFNQKSKKGFYVFSRSHEVHFATAFKMFKDRPLIGQGANMFRKKCSDEKFFIEKSSCTTHPHNFLFQMLAETGIIGTFFYIFIFSIITKNIISLLYTTKIKKLNFSNKQLKLYILNMGFIINSFVFILPNGNFFNNYLNAIIFIPLGFYIYQQNYDK